MGDEGLVDCVRDGLEDDGKGDSGARRILLPIVCKIKDSQLQIFIHKEIVLRLHKGLEEVKVKGNLQSLDFQRLFRHEESSLSS